MLKDNELLISEAYKQTSIKSPLDVVDILIQNATPVFTITKECKVFIWDANAETKRVIYLDGLTDSQLASINDSPVKLQGDKILEYVGQ